MTELVVAGFGQMNEADRVLTQLALAQKEYLLDLEDAVVAIRTPHGPVRLKQNMDIVGAGAGTCMLWGTMWGSLVVLMVYPLLGMAAGAALGTEAGALSASLAEYGVHENFLLRLGETLKPQTSALFILVRKVSSDKVLEQLAKFDGTILRLSLSLNQENALGVALSSGGVPMAGTFPWA